MRCSNCSTAIEPPRGPSGASSAKRGALEAEEQQRGGIASRSGQCGVVEAQVVRTIQRRAGESRADIQGCGSDE
jgi:hypothetical protein